MAEQTPPDRSQDVVWVEADRWLYPAGQTAGERAHAMIEAAGFTIERGKQYEEDTMPQSRMRIGDGPWIPVDDVEMTWTRGFGSVTVTLDQTPEREAARLRAMGVDPGRVIDGETVQPARKEIEGG